jgi:hypothetical protein
MDNAKRLKLQAPKLALQPSKEKLTPRLKMAPPKIRLLPQIKLFGADAVKDDTRD